MAYFDEFPDILLPSFSDGRNSSSDFSILSISSNDDSVFTIDSDDK